MIRKVWCQFLIGRVATIATLKELKGVGPCQFLIGRVATHEKHDDEQKVSG